MPLELQGRRKRGGDNCRIIINYLRPLSVAETVKRLRAVPSIQAAYQLHKNAATPADQNTDPALIANPNNSSGEFIHVSVEPDGSSYSVQVGADGAKRSFKTR